MLTREENEVLQHLGDAWGLFHDLPQLHPSDRDEFVRAIHAAQNIVMSRPVLRKQAQENKEGRQIASDMAKELRDRAIVRANRALVSATQTEHNGIP